MNYTEIIDRKELEKCGENIYVIINILGKRSNKIINYIKIKLQKQLESSSKNLLENILEKKEQIEIYRTYENLPKPTSMAIQELIDGKLFFYNPNEYN
ncbi:MAG: hypothetical protein ACFIN3_00950 [Candidatus Walczuchella monophlebidarum]|uniref:hypothetical protein n=1 Tax=Candidatus Walczuchella endosymbiont of Icerya purchasi TaxID=3066219 RepID=UPI00313D73F8